MPLQFLNLSVLEKLGELILVPLNVWAKANIFERLVFCTPIGLWYSAHRHAIITVRSMRGSWQLHQEKPWLRPAEAGGQDLVTRRSSVRYPW
jgi:hypothetical protein